MYLNDGTSLDAMNRKGSLQVTVINIALTLGVEKIII